MNIPIYGYLGTKTVYHNIYCSKINCFRTCHEKFGRGKKIGPVGPILANKRPKIMTPKFVRANQNWSGHITRGELISFFLKMADSSEEGDAKSGDLVEEAYEYLERNA